MLTSPSTASSRIPPAPAAAIATDAGVLMQASRRTRMRLDRGRRYRPPMGTMWGAEECLKRVQIACVETTRNTGWFTCDLLLDFTQSTWNRKASNCGWLQLAPHRFVPDANTHRLAH